jgi:hypothetical protein
LRKNNGLHSNNSDSALYILKKIIYEKEYRNIRILITISVLLGLSLLVYDQLKFSCQLVLVQNIIIPFFIATSVMRKENIRKYSPIIKDGFFIGGFVGALSSAMTLIISNIIFYFGGGRERALIFYDQPFTQLNIKDIFVGLSSQVFLWIIYTSMSAISGAFSSFFSSVIDKRLNK